VIETERLLLRELTLDDLDDLTAMFADEEVMRYIGAGGVLGRDRAQAMIEREMVNYVDRGWGEWATIERETGRTIGVCGLIAWPDIDGAEELEVAYLLAREAWGQGYATEAATAVRDHALALGLGERGLVSLIYPDNEASVRVAIKNGMTYEKDVPFQGHVLRLYRLRPGSTAGADAS
jgi:ribosomal-protein-alanine N-acetyltransferase